MKIVITGVSRGLGRALAEEFIAAGHSVFGCGRSGEAIFELRMAHPEQRFAVADVGLDNKVALWAADVLGSFGAPDILINNAALMCRRAPLWEQGDDEFTRLFDANVRGTANVIRHFVPPMVAAQRGVIVNVSSSWGRGVAPEVAPYCASKWAIEGLTRALAEELPDGMAAVTLDPGVIDTDMNRGDSGASGAVGMVASGLPQPNDWAKAAAPFILKISPSDNGKALTLGE